MVEKCCYEREKICRTCANTGSELSSLFVKEDSFDGICLSDMIRECIMYTVQDDDRLPPRICTPCKEKVKSAYDFKRQCKESHTKLLSMIESLGTETSLSAKTPITPEGDICMSVRKKSTRISAVKKRACEKCEQTFNTAEELKVHIKTEHRKVRFDCSQCSKGFTSEGYFKRHMIKIHQKDDTLAGDSREKYSVKSESAFIEPEISLCDIPKKEHEQQEELDFDFGTDNEPDASAQDDSEFADCIKEEPIGVNEKIIDSNLTTEALIDNTEKPSEMNPIDEVVKKESINKENEVKQRLSSVSKKSSHAVIINGERSFQCDQCEKSFKRKSHLQQHFLCHTKVKPFECNICQKRFGRHDNLKVHMSNHGQKHFKCNKCDRTFGQAYLLKRHYDQTHSEDKPFLCSECGQRFVRNGDLVIHMRRHSGEKPFKCQYCNKGFTRSNEMHVHERYHTGEKKHVCSVCGKAFQRPYNLLVHVRTHTGERPYQCPHCPKNFTQCSDLKAHIRRHTGERYRCDQCGRGFIHVFVLNQHKLTVHGIEVQSRIKRVAKLPDANTQ